MLTATQTKYARERVEAITRRKQEKLDEVYNGQNKLDNEQKIALLRDGNFTVNNYSYRWYDRIEFPSAVPTITLEEYNEAKADLKRRKDIIIDQLVLGDAEGALASIKAFEEDNDVEVG